jgi:hypothetical protein
MELSENSTRREKKGKVGKRREEKGKGGKQFSP